MKTVMECFFDGERERKERAQSEAETREGKRIRGNGNINHPVYCQRTS